MKQSRGMTLGVELGLSRDQARKLAALRSPARIQDFVNELDWNREPDGPTARSVAGVLEAGNAHCVEAAFVAGASLWLAGKPPLLMDFAAARGDVDHVVALFRHRGHWGAISKSNSPNLRYRDPIYRSLRELAISFFPQYLNGRRKTLRSYSVTIDLRRFDSTLWVTKPGFCHEVVDALTGARHFDILPSGGAASLRPLDMVEVRGNEVEDYPQSNDQTAR